MTVTKDRCLCGVHVHTGTQIVAWISIIFCVLAILFNIVALIFVPGVKAETSIHQSKNGTLTTKGDTVANNIVNIVLNGVLLTVAILLLLGVKKQKPGYYLPYLVITIIQMVIGTIVCIILFIISILLVIGVSASDHFSKDGLFMGLGFGLIFGFLDAIFFFYMFITIYFFFIVVNRSRKVTEEELYDKNSPTPIYYNQSQSQGYQPQRENPNYNDKV